MFKSRILVAAALVALLALTVSANGNTPKSCKFGCGVDANGKHCWDCKSAIKKCPDGSFSFEHWEVHIDLSNCKGGGTISWACCANRDVSGNNLCTVQQCDANTNPEQKSNGFGVKCETTVTQVFVLPYEDTSYLRLQIHDGQAGGEYVCVKEKGPDQNCCGGGGHSCDSISGVCEWNVTLSSTQAGGDCEEVDTSADCSNPSTSTSTSDNNQDTPEPSPSATCTEDFDCGVVPNNQCYQRKCVNNVCVDAPRDANHVCRPVNGDCDLAETCPVNVQVNCPTDVFRISSHVCRASQGVCDIEEHCTGSTAHCPSDQVEPSTTECRSAPKYCDVPENCPGPSEYSLPSQYECPEDQVKPSTTVCRDAYIYPEDGTTCDAIEYCTGSVDSKDCPADVPLPAGTSCRAKCDECDEEEVCPGPNQSPPVPRSGDDNDDTNDPTYKCPDDVRHDNAYTFKCGTDCFYCGNFPTNETAVVGTPGYVFVHKNANAASVGVGGCQLGRCQRILPLEYPACLSQCIGATCPNNKDLSNAETHRCNPTDGSWTCTQKWEGDAVTNGVGCPDGIQWPAPPTDVCGPNGPITTTTTTTGGGNQDTTTAAPPQTTLPPPPHSGNCPKDGKLCSPSGWTCSDAPRCVDKTVNNDGTITVTIDVFDFKCSDISWLCCRTKGCKRLACNGEENPTPEGSVSYRGATKCEDVRLAQFQLPEGTTEFVIQYHDGQLYGDPRYASCDKSQTCGGCKSSCTDHGVCDYTIVLNKDGVCAPRGSCVGDEDCTPLQDTTESCSSYKCEDQRCVKTYQPVHTKCRSRKGLCDKTEECSGIDYTCPGDKVRNAGEVCRRCQDGENLVTRQCDGKSSRCEDCPWNTVEGHCTIDGDITDHRRRGSGFAKTLSRLFRAYVRITRYAAGSTIVYFTMNTTMTQEQVTLVLTKAINDPSSSLNKEYHVVKGSAAVVVVATTGSNSQKRSSSSQEDSADGKRVVTITAIVCAVVLVIVVAVIATVIVVKKGNQPNTTTRSVVVNPSAQKYVVEMDTEVTKGASQVRKSSLGRRSSMNVEDV